MSIVVLGTIFVDIKGFPFGTYIPDGRNAGWLETVHGGVARNVAEDLANLGLSATMLGLVDESGTGMEVIDHLNRHHVDTAYIRSVPNGMGTWLAVFNEKGDVVASISQRPDLIPLVDVMKEHHEAIFKDCDGVAIEFDIDLEVAETAIGYAKQYGKKVFAVISNMTIASQRKDLLKQVDIFICNQQEAGILFDDDYTDFTPEEMQQILAAKLSEIDIPILIVTMGAQGAVYASADGSSGFTPACDVHVTDTTGAGDSFFAGVCAGLTHGKTLGESCRIGSRLAASVICQMSSVCPVWETDEFGFVSNETSP